MEITQNDIQNVINFTKNYTSEDDSCDDVFDGPEFSNLKSIFGDNYIDIINVIITNYGNKVYGIKYELTPSDVKNVIDAVKNSDTLGDSIFDGHIFDNFRLIYGSEYIKIINSIISEYFSSLSQIGGCPPCIAALLPAAGSAGAVIAPQLGMLVGRQVAIKGAQKVGQRVLMKQLKKKSLKRANSLRRKAKSVKRKAKKIRDLRKKNKKRKHIKKSLRNSQNDQDDEDDQPTKKKSSWF